MNDLACVRGITIYAIIPNHYNFGKIKRLPSTFDPPKLKPFLQRLSELKKKIWGSVAVFINKGMLLLQI